MPLHGGKVSQCSWSVRFGCTLLSETYGAPYEPAVCSPAITRLLELTPVGRNRTYIVGLNCFLFPSHRGCSLINCAKNSLWWRVKWATGVDFTSSFSIGYMFTGHSQRSGAREGLRVMVRVGGWGVGVRGSIGQGSCVLEPAKDCASQACSVPLNGSLNS